MNTYEIASPSIDILLTLRHNALKNIEALYMNKCTKMGNSINVGISPEGNQPFELYFKPDNHEHIKSSIKPPLIGYKLVIMYYNSNEGIIISLSKCKGDFPDKELTLNVNKLCTDDLLIIEKFLFNYLPKEQK